MDRPKRKCNVASETSNAAKRQRIPQSAELESESSYQVVRSRSNSVARIMPVSSSAPHISTRNISSSVVDRYIIPNDAVDENEDLCDLLGESEMDSEDDDSLPVRIISYFDIYDYETQERRILPMDIDPDSNVQFFGASGFIRPQLQAGDEDDDWDVDIQEDDSISIKLNAILEVWTDKHEIWIRTQYAWYILEYPSRQYRKYYERVKTLTHNYAAPSSTRSKRVQDGSTPFITPRVGKIAQGFFLRSLMMVNERVDDDSELQNICVPDVPFVVHATTPSEIVWGEEVPGVKGYYKSVFVDGVEYHIHDTVAVTAPDVFSSDEDVPENLSKGAWFAQICYFFDRVEGRRSKPEKYFHLRWFSHGSQTILGETANPQALFLLDECDDNPVEAILQKIMVRQLGAGDLEPVVISERDIGSATFHLSHKWDSDHMTMTAVDFAAEQYSGSGHAGAFTELPAHKQCYACAVRERLEFEQSCNKLDPDILKMHGKQYHVHDFVYVRMPSKQRNLLAVAQIVDLLPHSGKSDLQVCVFDRVQYTSDEESTPQLQRSLLHTGKEEIISADCLDGHCHVLKLSEIKDLDSWLDGPDNFILIRFNKAVKQCQSCASVRKSWVENEKLVKGGTPLRALDLFAGAGGLTSGMDLSGYVKTYWAVERCPSAAETLRVNHERDDFTVYNQDCNVLLKHAVALQEGKNPSPIRALGKTREQLPPLPQPGEVDLIMGGPPCQPFSGMNRFKRVDDIRQTCIPTALAYVEFYSPKYVLIENVTGLLHYRLNGRQKGAKIIGGVEAGMVKFIMRALTSLGYQCQMRVLNSADYGSPQQRNRVIFWASRLDVTLPKWPIPTHIPREGHKTVIRRIAEVGHAPVASRNEFEEGHQYAPFYAVTVLEAIDDLPSWDWKNPGIIYPKGVKGVKTEEPAFPADSDQWKSELDDAREVAGYGYDVLYASPPRNLYQAFLRKGLSKFARVSGHYTSLFSPGVVERTVNVPVRPLANVKDLPGPLRESTSVMGKSKERTDTYWRLDGNGQFRTMMTLVNPSSKGAFVIHPTDKRVLTVREQARAQGFPDIYEFCSVQERRNQQIKDMERQIGNAVPIHLAYALGRALGVGLVKAEIARGEQEAGQLNGWDTESVISNEL